LGFKIYNANKLIPIARPAIAIKLKFFISQILLTNILLYLYILNNANKKPVDPARSEVNGRLHNNELYNYILAS